MKNPKGEVMAKLTNSIGATLTLPVLILLAVCFPAQAALDEEESKTVESYQGIPVGFTEQGHPFLGDPDAKVILEEYSDYLCPFCGRFFQQTFPQLRKKYIEKGKLKYVFRDFPLAGLHPTAPKGSEAALCVAEQGAALFWAMHDELFANQRQWSRLPDPNDFLAATAEKLGADMDAYRECLESGRKAPVVEAGVAAGRALGFNGTPSFQFMNAAGDTYKLVGALPIASFSRLADPLIAGEKPPEEPKPPKPELPFWAKPEGLAPDPKRSGFNMAGDAYEGDPKAQLVVVEFTDFQCPSCRRHALEAQPVIDRDFVATGKVLWVVKHLPLKEHPRAPVAAVAAECAGDQGRFWEMRHLLFDKSENWIKEGTDADAELTQLAEHLELDMQKFLQCFHGREAMERVLRDLYDAQGVVRQTPTFVMLSDGKGAVSRGAKSAEEFAALLNARLASATPQDKKEAATSADKPDKTQ